MKRHAHARRRRRFAPIAYVATILIALLTGCGEGPRQAASTLGYDAVATSTTSVRVTFESNVGSGAEEPNNYRISGGALVVRQAVQTAPNTVLLGTSEQEDGRRYELEVSNVEPSAGGSLASQASAFSGGSERAPIVASAIALSSTEILVTYASPPPGQPVDMDDSALNPSYYEIVQENAPADGSSPGLEIIGASFERMFRSDRAAVLLETEPQDAVTYSLRVTNVTTRAGEKLIDPNQNVASFQGIPADDDTGPSVTSAVALTNTTVLVGFSEAVLGLGGAGVFTIEGPGGDDLAVQAVEASVSQALLTTEPQRDEQTTYVLTVSGVTDRQGNGLAPDPTTRQFQGVSRRGPIDGDSTPPRVSNVASTAPTSVLVTFTEPVQGGDDSAENALHYRIGANLSASALETEAVLIVTDAVLRPDRTAVELTTLTQSDIQYTLEVVNVKDLAGNQIAAPERGLDPSVMQFAGTAASGVPNDADGDGLNEAAEQKGWIVTVVAEDGTRTRSEVTSDPGKIDTDEDGVHDLDELVNGTNPRSGDTDGDGLTDDEELNTYYSEPTYRDTDGDGLRDGLEVNFFDISPIHADTDGDQLDDDEEIDAANRDPRIADVPSIQIEVGDVALTLDERFTYTDAEGRSQTSTSSSSTTLEQGSERTYATSDTQTMTSSIESTVGAEVSYSFPKDFGASVSASVTTGSSQEYSSTVSRASSTSSNRAYNESLEKSQTFESSSEVVREVVDAAVRLPISIGSLSDVAFTVENIEITALQQDPLDRSRIVPIATLIPEVALTGGESPRYNVGPGGSKSNIVFANREVFPQTVEALMKDPRGLIFKIANYDLIDELGRNFAYTQQEIIDRTASITVDYGDGRVETHQVATYDGFDGEGRPKGLTMARVLQDELGLDYATLPSNAVLEDGGTTRVLTRVGAVETNAANAQSWVIFTSDDNGDVLDTEVDFGEIVLRSGDVYRLAYMQDVDGDRLFAREEYLYGSDDDDTDSDDDEISDYDEIRTGWPIEVFGKTRYTGYSDPRREDSDSDGLNDIDERDLWGTDARQRDTDGDGIDDFDEVNGFTYRPKGSLYDETLDTPYDDDVDWVTNPLDPDTDGDGLTDGFEIRIGSNPQEDDAADFIDTDRDGLSDTEESTDCEITVDGVLITDDVCSSKYEADTDGDGLPDLLERRIGSNPRVADTDGDRLSDFDELDIDTFNRFEAFDANRFRRDCSAAENCSYDPSTSQRYGTPPNQSDRDGDTLTDFEEVVEGWNLGTDGSQVTSDPLNADVDADGLRDDEERTATTDPSERDTDGDASFNGGYGDGEEVTLGLDPLVQDQRIRVTLDRVAFTDNSEPVGNNGDMYVEIAVVGPTGSETLLLDWNDKKVEDDYQETFSGKEVTLIKTTSQSFRVTGDAYESDGGLTGDNDCVQTYDQRYDGVVTSGGYSWEIGDGCSATFEGNVDVY